MTSQIIEKRKQFALRFAAECVKTYPSFDKAAFVEKFMEGDGSEYDALYCRAITEGHGEDYATKYADGVDVYSKAGKEGNSLELLARYYAEKNSTEIYDAEIMAEAKLAALYNFHGEIYADAYAFGRSRGMGSSAAKNYAGYMERLVLPNRIGYELPETVLQEIHKECDLTRALVSCIGFRVDGVGVSPTKISACNDTVTLRWEGGGEYIEVCLDAQYLVDNDSQCSFSSSVFKNYEQTIYDESDNVFRTAKKFVKKYCSSKEVEQTEDVSEGEPRSSIMFVFRDRDAETEAINLLYALQSAILENFEFSRDQHRDNTLAELKEWQTGKGPHWFDEYEEVTLKAAIMKVSASAEEIEKKSEEFEDVSTIDLIKDIVGKSVPAFDIPRRLKNAANECACVAQKIGNFKIIANNEHRAILDTMSLPGVTSHSEEWRSMFSQKWNCAKKDISIRETGWGEHLEKLANFLDESSKMVGLETREWYNRFPQESPLHDAVRNLFNDSGLGRLQERMDFVLDSIIDLVNNFDSSENGYSTTLTKTGEDVCALTERLSNEIQDAVNNFAIVTGKQSIQNNNPGGVKI